MMKSNNRGFFDTALLKEFRAKMNSSNIFHKKQEYKNLWNLICVLMDRLDSSVKYLNKHINHPNTEDDFILFMVHATILRDGIYKLYENVYRTKPAIKDDKKWFTNAHDYSGPIFNETNCPTDDEFFEYLRALAFAHPFEIKKKGRTFIDDKEIQYSPWVITKCLPFQDQNDVGVRIYTNKNDSIRTIFISFENLKSYLEERFSLIEAFIDWGTKAIFAQYRKWKETKVERSADALVTLKNICKILDDRYVSHDSIDEAIKIIESSFNSQPNKTVVDHVKAKIEQAIPHVCDCVDELDDWSLEESLHFLYEWPSGLHENASYELEKIFSYLDDERGECLRGSDEEWGLIQAINFYNSYAKRFVVIDFEKMSYLEIKILIRCSLVVGREKEGSEPKNKTTNL